MKTFTIMIMILCFSKGLALNECRVCGCCRNGASSCGYNYDKSVQNYCFGGCFDGYFGDRCRHACIANCLTCTDQFTCTKCKDGYFGSKCEKCGPTCFSCTSYNKCIECEYGYYLSNGYCVRCQPNCRSCTSYQKCTECIAGKYNLRYTDCAESCRPECKYCVSYDLCTDCVKGQYGTSCERKCGRGCVNDECNKTTGICTCKTGFSYYEKCNKCSYKYYGNDCDIPCSKGCLHDICEDDGKCMYNCKLGFVGYKCINCEVGKYGTMCDKSCPDGCADNNCSSDGTCFSCKTGYYGNDCTESCPKGCKFLTCSSSGKCYSCKEGFTGTECEKCVNGMYGNKCDQKCSPSCLVCSSMTNCSACVDNHWGSTCQKCPKHCHNCSMEGTCLSCDTGIYGLTCTERCKRNCLGSKCDQFTGNCSNGCIAGFYGTFCELKCSHNCVNSVCVREDGACLKGCKTGYNGTTCYQKLHLKTEDGKKTNVTVGASAGGSILVLVIIVVIIVILIKRRRRDDNHESSDLKENESKNETMIYSEINDSNVTNENNYDVSIQTTEESVAYNIINNESSAGKSQEIGDSLYSKPIKPKHKAQGIKSKIGSSTGVTVNNPNYEEPEYKTINKGKANKPPIASKHVQINYKNAVRKSNAEKEAINGYYDENDASLEIEEDIESLSKKTKSVIFENNARRAAAPDLADTYYNVGALKKRKIKLDQLSDFVARKTKKDFADEFQTLPAMLIKPYVESHTRENLSKNRYKGIYPYDDTRVVLKDGESDYINASYIDGYNKNKAYIASIGPTTKYMGDMSAFWIMVWQEEVGKIVMLTNVIEGGVPKCDQYWPEKNSSLTFANIQVTCQTEEEYSDYTFRSFIVQKDLVKRNIVQVHFTAWPDKGTPDDVTSLIEFREKVNSTNTDLNGPILVHCSAGIGRTGTYIALDSVTKEGEAEGEVDIFALVRNMREQRVNMIQTAEQYQYLHNAIIHTLTFDSKAIQASKFSEYMKSHSKDNLEKMFEKLQASVEQRSDDENEAFKRNKALKDKNRDGADIPGDRNRPKLYMYMSRKPGSADYINALYVNSFKSVNRYLIAQTPLPETVEDFLTLIIQEKVSCIISMEDSSSVDKNIGIYYPADNQTLRKGSFTVKTVRGKGTDQYMLREMKISHKSKSGSEEVVFPHVVFTQWSNDKLTPDDPVQFVQFLRDVELKFCGNDTKRPILVHCSTGASKSGLFCVVSTLLEKAQIDQEVSVVNTVRQIKYRRHMAIPNKEQYIFCHHCVNEYMRTFETYSNFELKS